MPWPLVIALVTIIDSDASPAPTESIRESGLLRRIVLGPHQVGGFSRNLLRRHAPDFPALKFAGLFSRKARTPSTYSSAAPASR